MVKKTPHQSDATGQTELQNRGDGRVVVDERGRSIWEGTIRTVKLSLMQTGIFCRSEMQKRLTMLRELGQDKSTEEIQDELEIMDASPGFDPYDSDS